MKVTLVIGIIAAVLAGALLATALGDDDPQEVVTVGSPVSDQAASVDATQPPVERSLADPPPHGNAQYLEPDDRPIGRAELDRVRDAALRTVGGGTVTDIDRSDDLGVAYEVEVVQNGLDIDVRLDKDLRTVTRGYDD
jgi:hypothetical protein